MLLPFIVLLVDYIVVYGTIIHYICSSLYSHDSIMMIFARWSKSTKNLYVKINVCVFPQQPLICVGNFTIDACH